MHEQLKANPDLSVKAVCEQAGMSTTWFTKVSASIGLKHDRLPGQQVFAAQKELIIKMNDEGVKDYNVIAEAAKVSPMTVWKYLKAAGRVESRARKLKVAIKSDVCRQMVKTCKTLNVEQDAFIEEAIKFYITHLNS